MPNFARRKDKTHDKVVEAFLEAGWYVCECYQAPECPDFFAAHDGRTLAVEVKSKGGKLTEQQAQFRDRWPGEYYVVTDPAAVSLIIATPVRQKAVS